MNNFFKIIAALFLGLVSTINLQAQVLDKSWSSITSMNNDAWYASAEAKTVAENVLLYQRNIGGWPKNIQIQKPLSDAQKKELQALKSSTEGCTTDNNATTQEMLFLSKIYKQQPDERYKNAFLMGLDYLLAAQYANGGWPQFYPLKKGYYTHITYNDDSMARILMVLKEIKDKTDFYSIKSSDEIVAKAKIAFDKGIDCIIKTQYKQNGVLTAWCAQHDETTLLPAKARAYELPSLSGKESAKIVLLLMSIENPSKEVITAVEAAVAWFEKVKITGLREDRVLKDGKITDKKMVADTAAPDLWARFMELDDNKPFFCDRDGVKKYSLSEIGDERRNGYSWYTNEPKEVLKAYDKWKKKLSTEIKSAPKTGMKAPKDEYNIIVAQDGSGDYGSIQEAIYNSPAFPYQRVTITVKNGIYHEKVRIPEWNTKISLIGESKEKTIITFDDYFGKINLGRNSTFLTPTVLVEGNDCKISNLTIQNTAGPVGQAVALSVEADRVVVSNCILLGNQDTLYVSGEGFKQYYKDCFIEGTVDFIFGSATAVFENCHIHAKSNAYLTAASTPESSKYGFVFMNCKLTAGEKATEVYLGRPWRINAKTVYLNCEMGKHIRKEGWDNWSKAEAEKASFYAEYNCSGPGFQPESRAAWSHQLTKTEAKEYTLDKILGGTNSKLNWYSNFK
ncbi:pectinesterase [Flavobacterium glycines]|nr:pectate lyase [Flavobacterium glycines]OCB72222.1 pectate lyase [Flavobacterium glycines]SDI97721.1 pectinesterase [Flavobacterium glycines]